MKSDTLTILSTWRYLLTFTAFNRVKVDTRDSQSVVRLRGNRTLAASLEEV